MNDVCTGSAFCDASLAAELLLRNVIRGGGLVAALDLLSELALLANMVSGMGYRATKSQLQ